MVVENPSPASTRWGFSAGGVIRPYLFEKGTVNCYGRMNNWAMTYDRLLPELEEMYMDDVPQKRATKPSRNFSRKITHGNFLYKGYCAACGVLVDI